MNRKALGGYVGKALLIALVAILAVSCKSAVGGDPGTTNPGGGEVVKHTVRFVTPNPFQTASEWTLIGSVEVDEGSAVQEPAVPARVGYVFVGWYGNTYQTDNLGRTFTVPATAYNFSTAVVADTTVYARWEKQVVLNASTEQSAYTIENIIDVGLVDEKENISDATIGSYRISRTYRSIQNIHYTCELASWEGNEYLAFYDDRYSDDAVVGFDGTATITKQTVSGLLGAAQTTPAMTVTLSEYGTDSIVLEGSSPSVATGEYALESIFFQYVGS